MKILILAGHDKIGLKLVREMEQRGVQQGITILFDRSNDLKRVMKLLKRGSLSPLILFKMFLSELTRKKATPEKVYGLIRSNAELAKMIQDIKPDHVYLFRAGLVINKSVLALGPRFYNVHCASLPAFGGLGAISRALDEGVLEQEASLHELEASIDEGKVVEKKSYLLERARSYKKNEDEAYKAGIQLLIDRIKRVIRA